jgi:glycosyltransferase involved in cell wall biosynthesis
VTPEITVLMPVRNAEAYLEEAARSLLAQTFGDFELLAVDDGSTDRTPRLLAGLAAADARVRVLGGRERLGFSGALNLGLDAARGRLIARMDADDRARPDRLEAQRAYLDAHPDAGLCGGRVETFGRERGTFHRPPLSYDETRCYALFDNPFAHPTVMIRRDLLERHALRFDAAYCPSDDYELWCRCLRLFPCVNLDRVVLEYRVHAASLTGAHGGDMDRHAARVAARELEALGVAASEDEARFHRRLGRGRCFPIRSEAELARAEAWLGRLVGTNAGARRYPDDVFRRTAADIWFRACAHAGALGAAMLRRFAASPLRRARGTTPVEWASLIRAAVRRGEGA